MVGKLLVDIRHRLPVRAGAALALVVGAGFADDRVYLGIVLGFLLLLLLWLRRLRGPLTDIIHGLEKLADGDTDIRLSGLERRDEIGTLSRLVWRCREAVSRGRRGEAPARRAEPGETPAVVPEGPEGMLVHREGRSEISRATGAAGTAEAGSPSPDEVPFDLEGVVAGVAALVANKTGEKGPELVLDSGLALVPPLVGDPFSLSQVLIYLISNALKCTREGEVVVAVREKGRTAGAIELDFSVRDQGGGLAPEQLLRLFQDGLSPFRRPGETGFGLVLCKHLVEAMGGCLQVESQYGVGSVFHFTLRLKLGHPAGERPRTYARRLALFAGRRVMVVDDGPASRQVAGALLEQLGFVPDLFASGREALAALGRRDGPGYLFCCLDRALPDLDGLQLARQLRAHYGRDCPPLLLLAAGNPVQGMERAGREFDAVLGKPLSLGPLFGRVAAVLGIAPAGVLAEPGLFPLRAPRLKGKRVLVADRTELYRETMADALREAGLRVRVAASGLEVLQAVREEPPDCVLMGCRLPVMDGYEAAARLRALGYAGVPIIALAAEIRSGDRAICLAAGMDDFIGRPANGPALLAAVAKWLLPAAAGDAPGAPSPPVPAGAADPVREPLPPLPPGLDVASGLKRLHGKTALFLKALRLFRDSRGHPFQLEFRAAVAAEDWQTSERLAHSLKATAATIGAHEVSRAAARLEAAIRNGDYGAVQGLLVEVTDKLRAIVDGLAHIR